MHHQQDPKMQNCIQACWECRDECQTALFTHCLYEGGKHTEAEHVKLMADCIQICQTAADFMTRESSMHIAICAACAEICEACARSCEKIDSDHMKQCAETCRRCAQSCREMSQMAKAA